MVVSAIQRLVGAAVVLWSLGRLRRSEAFVAPQLVPLLQASRSTVIPRHASKMDQSGDVDSAFYSFADGEEEEDAMGLGAWVPVGSVSCLAGLGPSAIEIMGRQMVVWSSNDKAQWSVMTDVCPHRMVPLSQGRVDPQTGCLECPLHGWKFALNGTLQAIPHMEPQQPLSSKGRSVESFPVHRTGDLLWAFLPTSFHGEAFPKTLLPEDYYQGLRDLTMDKNGTFYVQDLPFSYDMLVENGLDGPAHAYFAHHKLGFDRSEVAPIPCEIVVANFSQLVSQVTYTRKGASRERRYTFQRPFLVSNQQPGKKGQWTTAILVFCVPIREGRSRLITSFETLRPHRRTPDWMLHILNKRFSEGDLVLHQTEHTIRSRNNILPKYAYSSSADTSTKAWRIWWKKYGFSAAPAHTFGPASPNNLQMMNRDALMDPWASHTRHCSKCRRVLRVSTWTARGGLVVAWLGAALVARRSLLLGGLLGLVGGTTSWLSQRLGRELEGSRRPSEVGDRGLSVTLE